MATRIPTEREYTLQGVVVDRATQRGVGGVHVEAWDRDTKYHDMLGQVVTEPDGAFTIAFDSSYFGNSTPDHGPDVYYKVLTQDTELLSTFDRPQHNLQRGTTRVKLEIELPQIAPLGEDRVTTERAIKMINWWQASDFRGAFNEQRDKSLTVGKMMTSLLGDAFKNFDFDPVQPRGTRENEIVNQTPDSARTALAQNQIEVTDVKPVSSLGASGGARVITGYPLSLRAQDRVTLYEDNGVVKYYTRDPAPKASADEQTVARIDGDVQSVKARVAGLDEMRVEIANVKTANAEIAARAAEEAGQAQTQAEELARLRTQLAQVQQVGAQKDVQIAKLQSDLEMVTKAQDNLAARLPLNRLETLEKQMALLSRSAPPAQPKTRVAKKSARKAVRRRAKKER